MFVIIVQMLYLPRPVPCYFLVCVCCVLTIGIGSVFIVFWSYTRDGPEPVVVYLLVYAYTFK